MTNSTMVRPVDAGNVMLCADAESLAHPECIGLGDETLSAQSWLRTVTDAQQAREMVRSGRACKEIWVAGSDQMDAVNLAAALKRDRRANTVCLLAFKGTGSLLSRARCAGIDEVLDKQAFLSRYGACKQVYGQVGMTGAAEAPAVEQSFEDDGAAVSSPQADEVASTDAVFAAAKRMPSTVSQVEKGYLLAIVGAGGGVGKSTVAVLSACIAQSMGYRTALVDGDLQFGDVHYLSGCDDALRIDDLLMAPARIESLKPRDDMPAVLAAPVRLERSEAVAHEFLRAVALLRSRFDVVIVNTGPKWDDQHISLLEECSHALFVIDQRPSSVRACKHVLDLCARCGVASQPFLFALNRCTRGSLFSAIDVSCALRGVRVAELADGGNDVEELLGAGQPLDLVNSKNPLCASLKTLLRDILPETEGERQGASASANREGKRKLRFANRRKKAACL